VRGNQSIPIIPSQIAVERDVGLYDATRPILLKETTNIYPYFNSLRSIDGIGGTAVVQPVGTPPGDPADIKVIFGLNNNLSGGNNVTYFCQSRTRLSVYNNATLVWNDLTGVNPALAGLANDGVDWTTWWFDSNDRDGVITCNSRNKPISWRIGDGSWSPLTNAPISRTIASVADRIVIGNVRNVAVDVRPDRVKWSAFRDETTWPALAIADLLTIGDSIVTIKRISRTAAIVYKDQSQWLMQAQAGSDAAAFRFELVDEAPGPIAVRAVAVLPGGEHYYLGNDLNIYRFTSQRSQLIARTSYELGLPVFGNLTAMDRYCHLVYLPKRQSLLCTVQPGQVSMSGFVYEVKTGRLTVHRYSNSVIAGADPDMTRDSFLFWEAGTTKTGFSKPAGFDDAEFEDALSLDLRIMLPIQAGVEYEVEGADLWFDKVTPVVTSFNDFTLSFYYGPDVDHLTQFRLHAGSTMRLDNLSYYLGTLAEGGYAETTLRGAVVQFRLKSDNFKDVLLNIHRINIYGWVRRAQS
jgi:hypothetical protein